jgi:hypothetical protein
MEKLLRSCLLFTIELVRAFHGSQWTSISMSIREYSNFYLSWSVLFSHSFAITVNHFENEHTIFTRSVSNYDFLWLEKQLHLQGRPRLFSSSMPRPSFIVLHGHCLLPSILADKSHDGIWSTFRSPTNFCERTNDRCCPYYHWRWFAFDVYTNRANSKHQFAINQFNYSRSSEFMQSLPPMGTWSAYCCRKTDVRSILSSSTEWIPHRVDLDVSSVTCWQAMNRASISLHPRKIAIEGLSLKERTVFNEDSTK